MTVLFPEILILTILFNEFDITTDLDEISLLAARREEENDHFRDFLQVRDPTITDTIVFALQEAVSQQIDCKKCGNCCKSLMIVVTEDELQRVAAVTNTPPDEFKSGYLAEGLNGKMIMNSMPCHFLSDRQCTIYADRFAGCREFPALHLPGFTARFFTVQMHYHRCPIIFNVVEQLKKELLFFTT
jgi:Fe-S-cluster containining protein